MLVLLTVCVLYMYRNSHHYNCACENSLINQTCLPPKKKTPEKNQPKKQQPEAHFDTVVIVEIVIWS